MTKRVTLLSLIIVTLFVAVSGSRQVLKADVDAPTTITGGPVWGDAVPITTNADGGKLPIIRSAPNDRDLMIGFVRQMSVDPSDTVAYYRESTNSGNSWSGVNAISSNDANTVTQLDVAYDGNNQAHAVWTSLIDPTIEIYYAKENDWPTTPAPFSETPDEEGLIDSPAIAADGDDIYIVWAENQASPLTNIMYRRSPNGGTTWFPFDEVTITGNISRNPDIAIGSDGKIHVVWQEGNIGVPTSIMYAQGTNQSGGGGVNWSTPLVLASPDNFLENQFLSPQLTVKGLSVHISYTDRLADEFADFPQVVSYLGCSNDCSNLNNWDLVPSASGQFVKENNSNPFIVNSTITTLGGCTLVYFHGIPQGGLREQIFGVNSCRDWGVRGRDTVTILDDSSINPKMTTQQNWYIHLVYEDVSSDGTRNILYRRNMPQVYAPLIQRQ